MLRSHRRRLSMDFLEGRCVPATLAISPTTALAATHAVAAASTTSTSTTTATEPEIGVVASASPVSAPSSGTTSMTEFIVNLSTTSTKPVTVNYTTIDGTALAGVNYEANSGTLTFAPGVQTLYVPVTLIGSFASTTDRSFALYLSGAKNSTLANNAAIATITPQPLIGVATAVPSVLAPAANSTSAFYFVVNLSTPSETPVAINYTTVAGTAVAGTDYTATNGTLYFAPGVQTLTVPVTLLGPIQATPGVQTSGSTSGTDADADTGKTFGLLLSDPYQATIFANAAVATIASGLSDVQPTISIATPAAVSSPMPGGTTTTVSFDVSLSNAYDQPVAVNYTTVDGSAVAGTDYTAATGTIVFSPGETALTIPVTLLTPTGGPPTADKSFGLLLFSPYDATLANNAAIATITAGGGGTPPTSSAALTVAGGTAVVGTTGTSTLTFTVSLAAASTSTVTVDYATADDSAIAGTDYDATSGTLTFAPGTTSETVTVTVLGETTTDTDKTLILNLTDPTNATITINSATGDILYASGTPAISVAAASDSVPTSGTSNLVFTVSLSGVSANTVTVDYATVDGTALAGTDYTSTTGTLTFAPGTTSETVTVPVAGESGTVTSKTLSIDISGATNTSNATGTAQGTLNYVVVGQPNDISDDLTNATGGVETATGTTEVAASFTTGTSAFTLDTATLLLDAATAGAATVSLYSDGGLQPGSLLETLSTTSTITATPADISFTSTGTALAANTTYWIVLSAASGAYDWSWTSTDTGSGIGFTDTWAESTDSGTTWFAYNSSPTQMSVIATAT